MKESWLVKILINLLQSLKMNEKQLIQQVQDYNLKIQLKSRALNDFLTLQQANLDSVASLRTLNPEEHYDNNFFLNEFNLESIIIEIQTQLQKDKSKLETLKFEFEILKK